MRLLFGSGDGCGWSVYLPAVSGVASITEQPDTSAGAGGDTQEDITTLGGADITTLGGQKITTL